MVRTSLVYRYVGLKVSGAYLAWLEDLYKEMRTSITVVLFVASTKPFKDKCVYLFTSEIKEQRILVQMIGAKVSAICRRFTTHRKVAYENLVHPILNKPMIRKDKQTFSYSIFSKYQI
ncbi:hypothetical protein BD560DRAFT_492339 [Blakeslea trispora]|nr:hypothetical protein BD560DRAFT_492339 [Blakeslea trispora]